MKDNVYWANSAAIVRAGDIFPLGYVDPSELSDDDLPAACLIAPVPADLHSRPFRCDCVERMDYPRHLLEVLFVSDALDESLLVAVRRRVDNLRSMGVAASVMSYAVRKGPISALDGAVMSSSADLIVLSDLMSMLPPDVMKKAAKVHLGSMRPLSSPFR